MISQVVQRGTDVADFADVTLCQRVLDWFGGSPYGQVWPAMVGSRFLDDRPLEVGDTGDTRELAKNIAAFTSGMAGDQYAAITLADR